MKKGNHIVDTGDLAGLAALWLLNDGALLADFDVNEDCSINLSEFPSFSQNRY